MRVSLYHLFQSRAGIRNLGVVSLLCLSGAVASAQGLSTVTGLVTDSSGAVVANATLHITSDSTNATRTATTNDLGSYLVTQLLPGTYTIRVESQGFSPTVVNGLVMPVNEIVTLNFSLNVGELTEIVEVMADAESLNTVNASMGVGFDARKIIDLPLNARNIINLLALQTGVQIPQSLNGGGQVNGARSDQQNINLDGVDVNTQEQGTPFASALPTTLDSVQEFIVQTAGQGGAASRSSGAQIHLVTKSGSNEWHGSAYEFYRTTGTSARNYFAVEPQALIRHIPGGSIGGHLIKDRLFFFSAYEHRSDRSSVLAARTVPTPEFINGIVRYQRADGTLGVITDGPGGALERFSLIPGDRWNPAVVGREGLFQRYMPFSTDKQRTVPSGDDGGANALTYRFNAPFDANQDVYVARIDYNLGSANTIFWRGTLNNDVRPLGTESFPGFNDEQSLWDTSRGFAAAWNITPTPTLNNNVTIGLTRQSFALTGSTQPIYQHQFSPLTPTAGAQTQAINTWNIADNFSWQKGRHSLQWGVNVRLISNHLSSFDAVRPSQYFAAANTTANGIGNASSPGLLRALGAEEFARVADPGGVGNAVMTATGSVGNFSEGVQFGIDGARLPSDTPFLRDFGLQEYDLYFSDSWRLFSNLTVTLGVHYSIATPPYEKNGVQVNWAQDLGLRYRDQRDTTQRVLDLPSFVTEPAGRANGRPDYYQTDKNNFAPRVAVAWTPGSGRTVLRGGYMLAYDRVGGRFARDAALSGSIGLNTRFSSPILGRSFDGLNVPRAPRIGPGFTLPRDAFSTLDGSSFELPSFRGGAGPTSTVGIDPGIRSPRNHLVNFTFSKELRQGLIIEASYVGRFARGLLGQADLASPVNLRDPQSGTTYYDAIREMFIRFENNGVSVGDITPIAWFENAYPELKADVGELLGQPFSSSTQAFYGYLHRSVPPGPNSPISVVDAWHDIERFRQEARLLSPQIAYFGLFTNASRSNYNSAQVTLRKRFGQAYNFVFNYTLSKSLDLTSAAEARGNRPAVVGGLEGEGQFEDPYNPEFSYARSDFDRRHQLNVHFLAALPFGNGRVVGRQASGVLEHIIGGWEVSGIVVVASGQPWNFTASNRFNHHFFGRSIPIMTKPVPFGVEKQDGRVFLVRGSNADRVRFSLENFVSPFPGGPIGRNQGQGPPFSNIDCGLTKNLAVTERIRVRLRAEIFNLFNHPNFSAQTAGNIDRARESLGEIGATISTERVMQFGIRLEF